MFMVKRNAIATKLTKICTQTQKRAFDVAVTGFWPQLLASVMATFCSQLDSSGPGSGPDYGSDYSSMRQGSSPDYSGSGFGPDDGSDYGSMRQGSSPDYSE